MKRSGGYRCLPRRDWIASAAVVVLSGGALMAPLPAEAGSMSYQDAFQSRVANAGSRGALDAFVVEAAKRGQYDQAISTLEEVLLGNPNDLDARLALARIYTQIGSYDIAAAHVEQALLTPGGEAFAAEIEALNTKIELGRKGLEVRMAVTAGVEYRSEKQEVISFAPDDETELSSPYVLLEGAIIRDLGTAARDEIRVGGEIRYAQGLTDLNFDGSLDTVDIQSGRFDVTFSKGLPDIIDTLRFDVSGYGLVQEYGGGRQLQEYGTEAALVLQPTVESQIRTFASYGWLGHSTGLHADSRARGGIEGNIRILPGLAVGAHFAGYSEWGTTPIAFVGGSFDYNAYGWDTGASVSHLLHVFGDGRSWVHEAGARYAHERILDYASLNGIVLNAAMADRDSWEVFWNHTVQIATHAEFNFGISYGREEITDTSGLSLDRSNESWGAKAGLTLRYN
jgi:hypothetical protein